LPSLSTNCDNDDPDINPDGCEIKNNNDGLVDREDQDCDWNKKYSLYLQIHCPLFIGAFHFICRALATFNVCYKGSLAGFAEKLRLPVHTFTRFLPQNSFYCGKQFKLMGGWEA